jgi:CRISPR-associated helicase Cas3
MLELNILPVSLDQVDTDAWLTEHKPYEYQWEAYQLIREAFESKQTLCLFLITPTGSGKTLAAYAHSIKTGLPMLGVYPTNELLADQERALSQEYQRIGKNRIIKVDSAALDEMQVAYNLKRHSQTLETILNQEPILLTNPDILFYVIFGLYPAIYSLRERLWALIGSIYRLFAFDEFHLYNVKQQADVSFFIGALHAINPNVGRVFIFASATPDLEMVELLRDKLGLGDRVKVVECKPSQQSSSYTIAHPVHLTLVPTELDRWQGLTALDSSFETILSFNEQFPATRYVAIFDAVAAAIGAARRFRDLFTPDLVGEVHGLSSETMRREALARKITVGTSTIEVGVDFKDEYEKDFLIFEARTSSQFLQRFGRLARHSKKLQISNKALAFVPTYVCSFFVERLGNKTDLTRHELRELVDEAYRQPQEFRGYLKKHASVEMVEATNLVLGMFQPDEKLSIQKGISFVIESLTKNTYRQAQAKRREYEENRILKPLLTFRGSGLEAAILDERGEDSGFPAKRYDVMFLLRRGIFEELSEEDFKNALSRIEQEHPEWVYEVNREKGYAKLVEFSPEKLLGVYGFFRLTGLLHDNEKTRQVWFEIAEEDLWGKSGKVTVVERLSVKTNPQLPIRLFGSTLRRKKIVAWIIDRHPNSIKFGRALPPLFAVYELKVIRAGGGYMRQPWSIAFNQDAFFLDSLYWNLKKNTDVMIV